MDIKQLRYFTHVAELGSYTRASGVIDVAQPVLSRQIRQLEIELRKNLLLRHGRGVVLTEAGEKLLKYSREIIQLIDLAQEDLSQTDGQLTGHIVLGLPPTLAKLLSVEIVKQFKQEFPNAKLTLVEALTVNIEESMHLGRIDIALINSPTSAHQIKTKLVAAEQLCLICHIDDPIADGRKSIPLKDISHIPLILPSISNAFRTLLEKEMRKQDITPNIVWEIDSVNIIMELVAAGMGSAILSPSAQHFVKKDLFKTLPITNPCLLNHLYIASSSKRRPTNLHIKVEKMLEKICQKYFPHSQST